ncbi:unnamed protein product, partial [marine sediment metagenome]
LLATLMSKPGQVFSRLELLNNIKGSAFEGYERNIDVHIRNLRAKIEPNPSNPSYIETIYGVVSFFPFKIILGIVAIIGITTLIVGAVIYHKKMLKLFHMKLGEHPVDKTPQSTNLKNNK